jgi:phosphate/sulfate permease
MLGIDGQNPLEEMGHAGIDDSCILRPLFGVGIANGRAQWTVIRTILLAWLLTLPTAAFLSGSVYLLIRQL